MSVFGGHRSDRLKADGIMTSDRVLEDGGANRMTGRRTAPSKPRDTPHYSKLQMAQLVNVA